MQAWVSCSGAQTLARDPLTLGGDQCGEQRGPDLKRSTARFGLSPFWSTLPLCWSCFARHSNQYLSHNDLLSDLSAVGFVCKLFVCASGSVLARRRACVASTHGSCQRLQLRPNSSATSGKFEVLAVNFQC